MMVKMEYIKDKKYKYVWDTNKILCDCDVLDLQYKNFYLKIYCHSRELSTRNELLLSLYLKNFKKILY